MTIIETCGRQYGRTLEAANAIAEYAAEHPNARIAIVAPHILKFTLVILPLFDDLASDIRPLDFRLTSLRFIWGNGSTAAVYSAQNPMTLRGPQHHVAWAHAVSEWANPEALEYLSFGLRLDPQPWVALTDDQPDSDA